MSMPSCPMHEHCSAYKCCFPVALRHSIFSSRILFWSLWFIHWQPRNSISTDGTHQAKTNCIWEKENSLSSISLVLMCILCSEAARANSKWSLSTPSFFLSAFFLSLLPTFLSPLLSSNKREKLSWQKLGQSLSSLLPVNTHSLEFFTSNTCTQ